ncbi:hypothetical protein [Streptomyces sp. IBSBF 2507]|uniref:hypothetical protein n=1 Tax=Streptomyces sp. IBSBF 2507 TaxID=2903530 RepID=UPI00351ECCCF
MKLTVRHLVRGLGRHRAPRIPGQLARQRFIHCPTCGVDTAATIHGSLVVCTEGHHVQGGQ